ncbi:site-specific integrase [Streptomyces sp. RerS4]|uniref:tyrosine-type recombinase/integrase n=1 Tax=Streptomyces sp. RerS4 TaxID=2942449 RepID=UPI00201C8F88|nr:site-specific integrase [Streptomyces sp. RerS4]UQX00915.1 site-specific integrase [Streptomyces sp. RerS4]
MAGHVQDRWYKTEKGPDGKPRRIKTDRYGLGSRYRARFIGPDGTEKSKSFPDKQKRIAEQWLVHVEADMSRRQYVDPVASRITFREYGEKWIASQTTDPTTRTAVEVQLRKHAFPYLGSRPLDSFRPEHIRDWLSKLEPVLPVSSYRRVIFASVSSVLAAAVDDELLTRNPCRARSVRPPASVPPRVVPWTPDRLFAVRTALPKRYRAMADAGGGCGLRQGEIFGLPDDPDDFRSEWLRVTNQVKVVNGHLVFAPPKRGKERDVPLPRRVAQAFREHRKEFPPVDVTLPWLRPGGPLVTKRLLFSLPGGGAVRRTDFNTRVWKVALVQAGVIPQPQEGERHQAAREHGMHALRHFYASVLLHHGENIKALSTYLGHSDPGFTLRVYTHLLGNADGRTRRAVDGMYEAGGFTSDGPQTAQEG